MAYPGSQRNENTPWSCCDPAETDSHLILGPDPKELKAVFFQMSGSGPKVGHGKIKIGLQIILEKLMSKLIGYAMSQDPGVSNLTAS